MTDKRQLSWVAHCNDMARATQAIADWCEDRDMLEAYVELAARWLRMAETLPAQDWESAA